MSVVILSASGQGARMACSRPRAAHAYQTRTPHANLARARCVKGVKSVRCRPNRRMAPPTKQWFVTGSLRQVSSDRVRDFDGKLASGLYTDKVPEEVLADLTPDERATVKLFQDNAQSVVNITVSPVAPMPGFFGEAFGRMVPQGSGSGFIWDKEGHIVTNSHVVGIADECKVTFADGITYTAKVKGRDREKDVAVLEVLRMPDARKAQLKPVQLGLSSNLLVGQKVFAIGNPFGLDQTLTQGLVSGLGREVPTGRGVLLSNVIQTDTALNPGNSGGPLLDSKGRLVGIATAILDPTGRGISSGVGFAIPIDTARGLVEQILQHGRVLRPALGIGIAPTRMLMAIQNKEGVLVLTVAAGGPAYKAGIRATSRDLFGRLIMGDIILAINGQRVKSERDLFRCLDAYEVGQTVELEVERNDGSLAKVNVELGDRSANMAD